MEQQNPFTPEPSQPTPPEAATPVQQTPQEQPVSEAPEVTMQTKDRAGSHKKFKIIAIIVGILIVVAGIIVGTIVLLPRLMPASSANDTANSATEAKVDEATLAKQSLDAASASESKGETEQAIAKYKESLAHYQAAGDEGAAQSVQLQITYLESLAK